MIISDMTTQQQQNPFVCHLSIHPPWKSFSSSFEKVPRSSSIITLLFCRCVIRFLFVELPWISALAPLRVVVTCFGIFFWKRDFNTKFMDTLLFKSVRRQVEVKKSVLSRMTREWTEPSTFDQA